MPALTGFSDNPFASRQDVLRASLSLLKPLNHYKSTCGARIRLPTATGTGFDEIAAQLEGFARPLWIVADLLSLKSESDDFSEVGTSREGDSLLGTDLDLNSWIRGLASGVDPQSVDYWGDVKNHDQRMVEMEPIAYALLSSPSSFFGSKTSPEAKQNLVAYLRTINTHHVPPSNWRWFRVLVNLALVKVCNVPYEEVKSIMERDLELLDTFYLGEGWSSDGLWSSEKKQVDYYSGSFAIQYSQLAYIRFGEDLDPERCERYRIQAREFAVGFWRFFDVGGAAIPFGRSLTYRFTFAAFWSAVVVANVSLPAPLDNFGVIKGLILRHLRWWGRQEDIFNTDGTLNIGYTYPNMYMSEDYNSPQSVYWCFKTFCVVQLSEDHPFWTCKELPHPLYLASASRSISAQAKLGLKSSNDVHIIAPAMQIVCSSREHHFLLSSGQFTKKTHKAREAKYSKFAYSSTFAFSVPVGSLLTSMGPDSTLSVSDDHGETWKTRWEAIDAKIQFTRIGFKGTEGKETYSPTLISSWKPWKQSEILVTTTLIPPSTRWPGWHVRIHKVSLPLFQDSKGVQIVDAGFAISCQNDRGGFLNEISTDLNSQAIDDEGILEGTWRDESSCLVLSGSAASGVFSLMTSSGQVSKHKVVGSLLKPDANTNLVAQRSIIPTIHHYFEPFGNEVEMNIELSGKNTGIWFATGIFAVAGKAGITRKSILKMWREKPELELKDHLNEMVNS